MELSFEEKKKKDQGGVPAILSNPLDGLDENSLLIQRSKTEPDRDSFLSGPMDLAKIVWGNVSTSNDNGIMTTVLAVGAAAGLAALAWWGLSNALGFGETNMDKVKMMKAPGRGHYIPRKGFEDSPSAYFRNLRAKNY